MIAQTLLNLSRRRVRFIGCVTGLFLLFLAACIEAPMPELPPAIVSVTPSPPAPTATVTIRPQTPTRSREEPTASATTVPPTSTTTAEALGPFAECPVDEATAVMPGGPLDVLIFNDVGAWRWSDQTQTVDAVPLPPDARSPLPSPDNDRFAYMLEPEEGLAELWVMDESSGNQRQLATVSLVDYLAYSPEYVSDAALSYRWLGDRGLLAYYITPVLNALGEVPQETVRVADISNGQTWTLVPGGEFDEIIYDAEGRQIAALSDDRVRLIDVASGAIQHDVALSLHDFWYSADYAPGSDLLVIFTEDGIALVDTAGGDVRTMALDYDAIPMMHNALLPPIHWLNDGHSFYTVTAAEENANGIFAPDATFDVWLVDTLAPGVDLVQSYQGSLTTAHFSPDRQRLAFWSQRQDNERTLFLADLGSGELTAYDRRYNAEFLDWHPDSIQFVYWEFREKVPFLGHLCRPARPLEVVTIPFAGALYWLGPERFISVEGTLRDGEVSEVVGPWKIHLRTVDGDDLLLDTVEGAAPQLRFGS